MVRALALVLLLVLVGEATGAIEFALGDDCGSSSAPCDPGCPACVLCACCATHAVTGQAAARNADRPDAPTFACVEAQGIPDGHRSAPPRQPPKPARA